MRLHLDLSRIAHLPKVESRFAAGAADPVDSNPEDFAVRLRFRIAR
jgi:hypothetical protein